MWLWSVASFWNGWAMDSRWDLTLTIMAPHIDGINYVSKIGTHPAAAASAPRCVLDLAKEAGNRR